MLVKSVFNLTSGVAGLPWKLAALVDTRLEHTVTNVTDSPVTIEIITELAVLLIRQDLTVSYVDGRTETVAERRARAADHAYWGASHDLLIADFYRTLDRPGAFWIDPREGARSLRLVERIYALNN